MFGRLLGLVATARVMGLSDDQAIEERGRGLHPPVDIRHAAPLKRLHEER